MVSYSRVKCLWKFWHLKHCRWDQHAVLNFRHQWPSTAVPYVKRMDTSASLRKPKHSYCWNFSDIFFFFVRQLTLNFSRTLSSMFQHRNRTLQTWYILNPNELSHRSFDSCSHVILLFWNCVLSPKFSWKMLCLCTFLYSCYWFLVF